MPLTDINSRGNKGLQSLFDISGIHSNPEKIDMTAIQPVVDMQFGGFAKLNNYDASESCTEPSSSIAGVQTKTWRILSYGNASGATQQIVVPVGHNFHLWGHKMDIFFDAAGAAAFNGKYISSELLWWTPDGTEICKWHGTGHVSSGCQLYAPGHYEIGRINMSDIQIIPAGTEMDLVWWAQDGSNFPANTRVKYCLYGVSFPTGAPLPSNV